MVTMASAAQELNLKPTVPHATVINTYFHTSVIGESNAVTSFAVGNAVPIEMNACRCVLVVLEGFVMQLT